jgi:hypothetical protein
MGRGEAYTGFSWGNLREGDCLGDPIVDGRIILTHLCLKFHYWNGTDVEVIYILLRKVITESDDSHVSAS